MVLRVMYSEGAWCTVLVEIRRERQTDACLMVWRAVRYKSFVVFCLQHRVLHLIRPVRSIKLGWMLGVIYHEESAMHASGASVRNWVQTCCYSTSRCEIYAGDSFGYITIFCAWDLKKPIFSRKVKISFISQCLLHVICHRGYLHNLKT